MRTRIAQVESAKGIPRGWKTTSRNACMEALSTTAALCDASTELKGSSALMISMRPSATRCPSGESKPARRKCSRNASQKTAVAPHARDDAATRATASRLAFPTALCARFIRALAEDRRSSSLVATAMSSLTWCASPEAAANATHSFRRESPSATSASDIHARHEAEACDAHRSTAREASTSRSGRGLSKAIAYLTRRATMPRMCDMCLL
mmetsp:Transcript_740/g.2852  ORF Transcript_740/g.2852 Transcript_740/m.2852 type:complete len:210 (-) Transcript_740:1197-1826(-)